MTDDTMLDVLRQIGARVAAAAHIVKTSQENDDIRHTLYTLVEDCAEDIQSLCLEYCAVNDTPLQ